MATLNRIEMNYFGLTLYITTRTGKDYACKAVTWEPLSTGKGLRVYVQTWPGYGSYRGWVQLNRRERELFFETMKIKV